MERERGLGSELARTAIPIAIVAAGAVTCWVLIAVGNIKEEDHGSKKTPAPLVTTISVAAHREGFDLDVDGVVVPYREIVLATEVAGRVVFKAEVCRAGKFVAKDTPLIGIDQRDYELAKNQAARELEQAESMLKELDVDVGNTQKLVVLAIEATELQRTDYNRTRDLAVKKIATAAALDNARRNVLTAENALLMLQSQLQLLKTRRNRMDSGRALAGVKLEKAELDMTRTNIAAPIDGVVVTDSVEIDSYVTKGTQLAVIEDTSAVEIKCNLRMDELYWLWLQDRDSSARQDPVSEHRGYQLPETPATIVYRLADREYRWDGVLSRYEGIGLDEATRTVPCRVVVKNPRGVRTTEVEGVPSVALTAPPALVRGMFVAVHVHAKPQVNLLSVPETAIRPGSRLWRVSDGKLRIVQVRVLAVVGDTATVQATASELAVGDKIVTSPLAFVGNNMAVREQGAAP